MNNTVENADLRTNDIITAARKLRTLPTEVMWNGVKFKVKHKLSLERAMKLVRGVVTIMTSNGADYRPEVAAAAEAWAMLTFYTDLPPIESVADAYEVAWCNELTDIIKAHIDTEQYDNLMGCAKALSQGKIRDNACRAITEACSVAKNLMTTLDLLADNISKVGEKVGNINFSEFENIRDKLSNILSLGDKSEN